MRGVFASIVVRAAVPRSSLYTHTRTHTCTRTRTHNPPPHTHATHTTQLLYAEPRDVFPVELLEHGDAPEGSGV